MSVKDRLQLARDKVCCLNCLGRGHLVESCKSTRICMIAGCVGEPKHHRLLHDVALNENSATDRTLDTCSVNNARRQAPDSLYFKQTKNFVGHVLVHR